MTTGMPGSWMLESVERDGAARGAVAADAPVRSCPGWTGGDLLAHVSPTPVTG